MIWFWIIAGSLVLVALILLLMPLVRAPAGRAIRENPWLHYSADNSRTSKPSLRREGSIRKRQRTTRAEITRRMLAAADQESDDLRPGGGSSARCPGASAPLSGLPAYCRRRRSRSIPQSEPLRQSIRREAPLPRAGRGRMTVQSSRPRPNSSRSDCNENLAMSRAGSCSAAPSLLWSASPTRVKPTTKRSL